MRLYPAIDIKDGKCVRLTQGLFDNVNVYSDTPWEIAKEFEKAGAKFIQHLRHAVLGVSGEGVVAGVVEHGHGHAHLVGFVPTAHFRGGELRFHVEDEVRGFRCGG